MQIILLSGGSGKRLWSLSNEIRSKQFIKLLTAPDGSKESMVQRVVRQLLEADICDSITVATSQAQHDAITNQLGEEIPVVTEPERRDTFPAIALASSYLAYERKCPAGEIVVVMPFDPYTEAGYFETIRRMADAVKSGVAELVLDGIRTVVDRGDAVTIKKGVKHTVRAICPKMEIPIPLYFVILMCNSQILLK